MAEANKVPPCLEAARKELRSAFNKLGRNETIAGKRAFRIWWDTVALIDWLEADEANRPRHPQSYYSRTEK